MRWCCWFPLTAWSGTSFKLCLCTPPARQTLRASSQDQVPLSITWHIRKSVTIPNDKWITERRLCGHSWDRTPLTRIWPDIFYCRVLYRLRHQTIQSSWVGHTEDSCAFHTRLRDCHPNLPPTAQCLLFSVAFDSRINRPLRFQDRIHTRWIAQLICRLRVEA